MNFADYFEFLDVYPPIPREHLAKAIWDSALTQAMCVIVKELRITNQQVAWLNDKIVELKVGEK